MRLGPALPRQRSPWPSHLVAVDSEEGPQAHQLACSFEGSPARVVPREASRGVRERVRDLRSSEGSGGSDKLSTRQAACLTLFGPSGKGKGDQGMEPEPAEVATGKRTSRLVAVVAGPSS